MSEEEGREGGGPDELAGATGDKAASRAVRKFIYAPAHEVEIHFPRGFQPEVTTELGHILSNPLQKYRTQPELASEENGAIRVRNISFRQIFELVYRSRCIRDLLWILAERRVGGYAELKKVLTTIPWELILPRGIKLAISVRSLKSRLFHESGIRDVARSQLSALGVRIVPHEELEGSLNLTVTENRLRVGLSCFGRSGDERGYKIALRAIAPMKSTLAATLFSRLARSGANRPPDLLLVPFAGSGTLAVEGLLFAADLPGGLFRHSFLIEELPCATPESNRFIRQQCIAQRAARQLPEVVAIESDEGQVEALKENLTSAAERMKATLQRELPFAVIHSDYRNYAAELGQHRSLLLPLNPPYGERLRSRTEREYLELGGWVGGLPAPKSGFVLSPFAREEKSFLSRAGVTSLAADQIRTGGLPVQALFFDSE